jgi:hypothetical protein
MAKAEKAPRKRKPEYAPKRPVLSVRLPEWVFANISAEAKADKVSVTEVVYRRLLGYEYYRMTFGGIEAPDGPKEPDVGMQLDALEAMLGLFGYTRISVPGGTVWAEQGVKITSDALPFDLEATITAAVERAVASALKDRKE